MMGDFALHHIRGQMGRELERLRQASGRSGVAQSAMAFGELQSPDFAEKGEPSAAAPDQPIADQPAAEVIVDSHRAMHLTGQAATPGNHRPIRSRHPLDRGVLVGLADQQHAV